MEFQPPAESRKASSAWLWNGSIFEPVQGLPVTDRAFRYGMSLFESFPVRDGAAPFLAEHFSRLRDACAAACFSLPANALDHCETILRSASATGFARIYVTAGDGTVTSPYADCRVLILVELRDPIPGRVYHRGYDLGIHAGAHNPLFPGLKTGNYWANLHAFREGVEKKHNETLLFTHAGHLISACMANVFVVKAAGVVTPDLCTGARPGVVREWVMRQLDVKEALLTRAEVEQADEIFLTSSWLGIMPAASIESRALAERRISAKLLNLFHPFSRINLA